MKWTSAIRSSASLERALHEAALEIKAKLQSDQADLGLLFVSSAYRSDLIDLWSLLKKELPLKHLLGCTGGGVIGGGHEIEDQPAVSLTAAILPDVRIVPFRVQQGELPDLDTGPKPWRELVSSTPETNPNFLVLSDPFSLDADALISGLDFAFPNSIKVGGLASGGTAPNENLLLSDEKILSRGAVGVALSGDIFMEAVVAQGCRPIGRPLSITEADGNVMLRVEGNSPVAYLQELFESLPKRDQDLMQTSLFLGLLMDPFKKDPKQGDFLIRNIIGVDHNKGVMAVGSFLRNGQTVQFHLRDAHTSRDDLKMMLSRSQSAQLKSIVNGNPASAGAVLFSCLGRGRRLYGKPDFDSNVIKSVVGDIPVGGFFCNGEIGPVSGRTYLHGYTSSIAVISPSQKT